jgi:hypothetical protein
MVTAPSAQVGGMGDTRNHFPVTVADGVRFFGPDKGRWMHVLGDDVDVQVITEGSLVKQIRGEQGWFRPIPTKPTTSLSEHALVRARWR